MKTEITNDVFKHCFSREMEGLNMSEVLTVNERIKLIDKYIENLSNFRRKDDEKMLRKIILRCPECIHYALIDDVKSDEKGANLTIVTECQNLECKSTWQYTISIKEIQKL